MESFGIKVNREKRLSRTHVSGMSMVERSYFSDFIVTWLGVEVVATRFCVVVFWRPLKRAVGWRENNVGTKTTKFQSS